MGTVSARWNTPFVGGAALFVATFLVYANSLTAFFVGDDFEYLADFRHKSLGEVLRYTFWVNGNPCPTSAGTST